jgi:hypothetical protein
MGDKVLVFIILAMEDLERHIRDLKDHCPGEKKMVLQIFFAAKDYRIARVICQGLANGMPSDELM